MKLLVDLKRLEKLVIYYANLIIIIILESMNANKIENPKSFTTSNITIFFTILYIVLFEFTWVTQSIFPKPSQIIESFQSLLSEYNLLDGFFETTAIVFPAVLLTIVLFEIFIKAFLLLLLDYRGIKNISVPFKYFSFFFFALILNYLFPESLLAEFIFALVFVFGKLFQTLSDATESINEEYILTAKSLGLSETQILSKVVWKNLKPVISDKYISIHTQTWGVVLVYEFVGAVIGVGSIYRLAFDYNDLLAIISLGIFIALVVLIVNTILKVVVSKLVFWK